MKKIFLYSIITPSILFFSCGAPKGEGKTESASADSIAANDHFAQYSAEFIESLWKLHPGWASSVGYHKYDSILTIPNESFRKKELEFIHANLDSLKHIKSEHLNPSNKTDYYILQDLLNGEKFNIDEFKSYEWNPSSYNVSSGFAEILQNKKQTKEEKLRILFIRMKNIPAYYQNAKSTISKPTIEHTDLAIQQNIGGEDVFKGMMMDSLKKSSLDDAEKKNIANRINESVKAIYGFVGWLKTERAKLKPETAKSFRLGKKLYEDKFKYEIQSGYDARGIYDKAVERKNEVQKDMIAITMQLYKKYFPNEELAEVSNTTVKKLIDEISKQHVNAQDFQTEIEKEIPVLTKFVTDHNLVDLDPSKPLKVRKEPAYMAGVAGASMSSPGPYDKEGDSYYNVGSLENYSKADAESYLREYNKYILQILSIHEAIPGHYVQLVYSNKTPSLVKSLFGNGAMVEGWAVYSERMMMEAGFGAGSDSLEMRLMYDKWHLRSVCNTILDYSVHVLNMAKDDAINLLVNDAFQQKKEAENKWRRVTLTQVQLDSYFTGYQEIYDLREEIKKKLGDKFNLKQFNEKFLSYGSAPVKYIRELMLADLK